MRPLSRRRAWEASEQWQTQKGASAGEVSRELTWSAALEAAATGVAGLTSSRASERARGTREKGNRDDKKKKESE